MSDIFNEVDEELRRERFRRLWEQYGIYVIALALLIIVGVGGWRGYEWWHARQAAAAGATFESAVTLTSEGKHDEAAAAFARIADEGTAYRTLARLRQAAEIARRDPAGAVRMYDDLAGDGRIGEALQDLARVRGSMLSLDNASLDEMGGRLEQAAAEGRVFRHSARELMAYSAWRAGNTTAIKRWYDAIVADPETPVGVRTRTEMLMSLSAADTGS